MTFESLIKKAFFIFLSFVVIKANAEESNITVLMYHRIGDERYPSTSISKELFEKHIDYLNGNTHQDFYPKEIEVFQLLNNKLS